MKRSICADAHKKNFARRLLYNKIVPGKTIYSITIGQTTVFHLIVSNTLHNSTRQLFCAMRLVHVYFYSPNWLTGRLRIKTNKLKFNHDRYTRNSSSSAVKLASARRTIEFSAAGKSTKRVCAPRNCNKALQIIGAPHKF